MARTNAYEIGVGLDSGPFEKSVANGIVDPLEEAADAFDNLEKAAGDARLDRELDKAQKATDELDDELKDARDSLKKLGYAARDAGDDSRAGMRDATEGVQDFKQEANQSAKETAASFDGSAESIVGAFQEIAANAFGGFGPAGAVAGLLAAAGIGLAVAGFDDVQKAQEAAEASAAEWANKFIESGQRVATAAQQTAGILEIVTDPEKLKAAKDAATAWGVENETAIQAIAGNAPALQIVNDAVDRLGVNAEKAKVEALALSTEMGGTGIALLPVVRQYDDAAAKLAVLNTGMEVGAEQAQLASDSLFAMANSAEDATEQVDELGNKVVTLPGNAQIFIDAKTGLASSNLDGFKGDLDTLPESKVVNLRMKVDESEWLAWQRKPRQFTAGVTVRGKEWY